jgi:hypothetical protein
MNRSFIMTIDTEGDNLWARRPGPPTTRNARFLPRFQALCEKFGFKPTYLTTYEMARDPFFVEFGRDVIRRGAGEIGGHPHPWDSPPDAPLTVDDHRFHPYMIEYPEPVAREKLACLTGVLEENFQVKMISHRAGRWGMNGMYARLLVEQGYRVDCSVTPHISWVLSKGHPDRSGGVDYRRFPGRAYCIDFNHIGRPGASDLLEVPMTIRPRFAGRLRSWLPHALHARALTQGLLAQYWPVAWMRPMGANLRNMLWLLDALRHEGGDYVMFMLHSSEFMPGGSPNFSDEKAIERLYADLETLFEAVARGGWTGATLAGYANQHVKENCEVSN